MNLITNIPHLGESYLSVTGIDMVLTSPGCSATADGTAAGAKNGEISGKYLNSTYELEIKPLSGTMKLYNVTGCPGLFKNGDRLGLGADYTISPAQTITSPQKGSKLTSTAPSGAARRYECESAVQRMACRSTSLRR